jgi:hypothetical protein
MARRLKNHLSSLELTKPKPRVAEVIDGEVLSGTDQQPSQGAP